MTPDLAQSISDAVKDLARAAAPDVSFQPKYGGEVMIPDAKAPTAIVGGIYVYKDYVSVEFSNGAGFDDPGGVLEGKGKARRHVKLRTLEDLATRTVAQFLKQAFA
jgi:hypothetical protein